MRQSALVMPILALFGGVLFLIFGLILAPTIISQAVTAGETATIGSFSGSSALNNLIPFIYYTVVLIGGLGMIGGGGFGVYKGISS